jgi:hypothetical protein
MLLCLSGRGVIFLNAIALANNAEERLNGKNIIKFGGTGILKLYFERLDLLEYFEKATRYKFAVIESLLSRRCYPH